MTTQVSKRMKAKMDALAEALTQVAREAQPRPGFFVELIRGWEPEDPEGEREAHEVFYFVVDGSEDEWAEFHPRVRYAFWQLANRDPRLRSSVGMTTIFTREVASVVRR